MNVMGAIHQPIKHLIDCFVIKHGDVAGRLTGIGYPRAGEEDEATGRHRGDADWNRSPSGAHKHGSIFFFFFFFFFFSSIFFFNSFFVCCRALLIIAISDASAVARLSLPASRGRRGVAALPVFRNCSHWFHYLKMGNKTPEKYS